MTGTARQSTVVAGCFVSQQARATLRASIRSCAEIRLAKVGFCTSGLRVRGATSLTMARLQNELKRMQHAKLRREASGKIARFMSDRHLVSLAKQEAAALAKAKADAEAKAAAERQAEEAAAAAKKSRFRRAAPPKVCFHRHTVSRHPPPGHVVLTCACACACACVCACV